jgi:two-component system response regulator AgrA
MHNFIILDDDITHNNHTKKRLDNIIRKHGIPVHEVFCTTNPKEVLLYSSMNKSRNNIYLLDVNVQCKITGIDVAGMIRKQEAQAYLVFISAYPEFVMPSLKTKVFDYLIKPVSTVLLEACILSVIRDFRTLNKDKQVQTLNITSGFKEYHIPLEEIVYFEKYGHVLIVHTVTARIEGTESLESIEQKLDQYSFYRNHKSYIVNISYISGIDYTNNMIRLKNGEECPVSKRHKKELKLLCSQL